MPTDITEDTIRAVALPMGLVDVKVCAVTEVWSGLKLVGRKELRWAMQIWDDSTRYGTISRALHWGMALLLLWQFSSAASHLLLEDTAIEQFLWPTHRATGSLLFLLIWVRLIWAVINRARRPASVSRMSTLGHYVLYALLLVTPSLGLLRQYGGGRAFSPFGIPLFPGTGTRVEWMVAPGNLLHSWFGWTLLALIIGHIVMVWWHRRSAKHTDVLPRMWR